MIQTRFRVVQRPVTVLGESPVWDADRDRLVWVDSIQGAVLRCAPDGSDLELWDMPEMVGSLVLRAGGGAILTLASGLFLFDFETGELEPVSELEPDLDSRPNDGVVDRQGRFVTGTMNNRLLGFDDQWLAGQVDGGCSLYRVDADLSVTAIKADVGITNGPCFSRDGGTFYLSDSWKNEIQAFDYDAKTGTLSNERVLVDYDEDRGATGLGVPDGATVDSEGFIWSVANFTGELRRYSPEGELDRRIQTPVVMPTSLAFGGPDLSVLFLTSMAANPHLPSVLPPAGPLAGGVFALDDLGVSGVEEQRFAG